MGIKGTVRRATDGHIIHTNIDTDVIVSEEPELGSTRKPEEMYTIIEHFCNGRRRLELFGEDHNIRNGWVTVFIADVGGGGLGVEGRVVIGLGQVGRQSCVMRRGDEVRGSESGS
ncbi:hypothetical protein GPECTOR_3g163 [Gonium pectorale]|uniref:Uncharacterized protein n=1 Tax=Gonium pectorale TaxID=33097 RepID=A0A150GYT1_GONPE|nr:hypothetical protein GPECTOR_3g163 [Gonium pectorale]|eukprot:KXZ54999.1 hypothetical protein GPECTOR_3g163 [Gonium pectorale]